MEHRPLLEPGPGNPARRLLKRLGNRPARRHALRTLFRCAPWRAEGRTIKWCADRLNAEGWTSFRGRRWTPTRLSQILKLGATAALDGYSPLDPDDERAAIRRAVFPQAHMEDPCRPTP